MAELFALRISEGAIANALRRAEVVGCDETGARLTTADQGNRIVHNAYRIELKGDSMRRRAAQAPVSDVGSDGA